MFRIQKKKKSLCYSPTCSKKKQGSELREQLRMPCQVCLNGAVTHKAPQTLTCSNYCNLHLRLAQTSHASKRHKPQEGPRRRGKVVRTRQSRLNLPPATDRNCHPQGAFQRRTVVSVVSAHTPAPSFLSSSSSALC